MITPYAGRDPELYEAVGALIGAVADETRRDPDVQKSRIGILAEVWPELTQALVDLGALHLSRCVSEKALEEL